MDRHTIVDTLPACREAVRRLERENILAVDSEGVHLSRTGPLTLLQIGTSAGHVFLFDILREPRMFQDGGLKRLLESDSILKVLHSGKNDAEALYWQHKIELRNVHDTQVAHMEVQRSEGRKITSRGKLSDICAVYCPEKTSLVDAEKDAVTAKMNKTEGEYWAKRPLTQEMISYAANDVIALIPEMHSAQEQLLKEKGLTQSFKSRVERELRSVRESDVAEALKKEEHDIAVTTLRELAGTVSGRTRFQDIKDDDVVSALSIVRLTEMTELGLPPMIRDLKLQQIKAKMEDVEKEMLEKGEDYDAHGICRYMYAIFSALDPGPLKDQAQGLLTRLNRMVLEDIKNKYTVSTPLSHIAPYEKRILSRELRPRGEHDPSVNPALLRLYWKVKLDDLEYENQKFKADPIKYQVSEGFVEVLRFFVSGEVPDGLKERARVFLNALQDLGKVSRPTQASANRLGSGRARFGRRY